MCTPLGGTLADVLTALDFFQLGKTLGSSYGKKNTQKKTVASISWLVNLPPPNAPTPEIRPAIQPLLPGGFVAGGEGPVCGPPYLFGRPTPHGSSDTESR